jgi:hypothetical protein
LPPKRRLVVEAVIPDSQYFRDHVCDVGLEAGELVDLRVLLSQHQAIVGSPELRVNLRALF